MPTGCSRCRGGGLAQARGGGRRAARLATGSGWGSGAAAGFAGGTLVSHTTRLGALAAVERAGVACALVATRRQQGGEPKTCMRPPRALLLFRHSEHPHKHCWCHSQHSRAARQRHGRARSPTCKRGARPSRIALPARLPSPWQRSGCCFRPAPACKRPDKSCSRRRPPLPAPARAGRRRYALLLARRARGRGDCPV